LGSIVEFFRSTTTEQAAGNPVWFIIGFTGQMVFVARFILQWIVSEYKTFLCSGCFLVHITARQRNSAGVLDSPKGSHLYAWSFP
jgi:hypothetical protein